MLFRSFIVGLALFTCALSPGCLYIPRETVAALQFPRPTLALVPRLPDVYLGDQPVWYVNGLALSHDGGLMACAQGLGVLTVWDVPTERPSLCVIHPINLRCPTSMFAPDVRSAAISPDCKLVATYADDARVRLLDARTGGLLRTILVPLGSQAGIVFSPDGRLIAAEGPGERVTVWEVETGRRVRRFSVRPSRAGCLAFSRDGRRIGAGTWDGRVLVWDTSDGSKVHEAAPPEMKDLRVRSIAFDEQERPLAAASRENLVLLYIGQTGRVHRLYGHQESTYSLALTRTGRFLASADQCGMLKLWDSAKGREIWTRRLAGSDGIPCLAFSGDGRSLVVSSGFCVYAGQGEAKELIRTVEKIQLWDVATGQERAIFQPYEWDAWSLAYSPDGRLLASGSVDGSVRLWDTSTGRLAHTLSAHQLDVLSLAFSPDGTRLVTGSFDSTAKVWEVGSWRLVHTLTGHKTGATKATVSNDGQLVATGSGDKTVKLWDLSTGELLRTLTGHTGTVFSVAFSPDGKLLASSSGDETVRLWNVATGEFEGVLCGTRGSAHSLSWSPDGRFLAAARRQGPAEVWDLSSRRRVCALKGHSWANAGLRFSPDGHLLAETAAKGEMAVIRFWDTRSWRLVRMLEGHDEAVAVQAIAFAPKGGGLASCDDQGSIYFWDLSKGRWLAKAAALSGTPEWVTTTPEGFYVATGRAERSVGVRVGPRYEALKQYSNLLCRPDLVAKSLACGGLDPSDLQPPARFPDARPPIEGKFPELPSPPEVRFVSPEGSTTSDQQTVQVTAEARDQAFRILELTLSVNGKVQVSREPLRVSSVGKASRTWTVTLSPGENRLEVCAQSSAGVTSRVESLTVRNGVSNLRF